VHPIPAGAASSRSSPTVQLDDSAAHLEAIIAVQNEIATAIDLDLIAVMRLVCERAQRLTHAFGAVVELVEGDDLVYRAASGALTVHLGLRIPAAHSISGSCVELGRLLHCTDTETDDRVNLAACRTIGARSMLVVPLLHEAQTTGVLKVTSPVPAGFGDRDARTLQLLAGLIGAAMSRAAQKEAEAALAAEREATMAALRESQAAALAANRLKSEFLSTMSHELRTPMNAIIGYSHLLLDGLDGELTEQQAADIGQIARSADQLLALINAVLDLSKIEAGRMDLFPETVDLAYLVQDVAKSLTAQADAKGLAIEIHAEPGDQRIEADPMRVRQVLLNLIANAVKFTERGSVRIVTKPAESWVDIEVIDTGIGIHPSAQPFIFDEFRQADGSTSRRFGGTGLGLAISRNLARLHGGEIDFTSQPDRGSTFRLRLPRALTSPPNLAG
jgi:signal transduction histidine kinase